jgi:hypothetical protein
LCQRCRARAAVTTPARMSVTRSAASSR